MHEAVIVDVVRTPAGRRNGKLKDWHPTDLGAHVLKALQERNDLDPSIVDDARETSALLARVSHSRHSSTTVPIRHVLDADAVHRARVRLRRASLVVRDAARAPVAPSERHRRHRRRARARRRGADASTRRRRARASQARAKGATTDATGDFEHDADG